MTDLSPATHPSVPPSVAEWEDLLLRMEIMQRVLRNTLEPVAGDDSAAAATLRALVEREAEAGAWLERVSGSDPQATPRAADDAAPLEALAARFVSLRARNFAMLQRRGLEVWRWTTPFAGFGEVSAYQLVGWLVAHDVLALAELRRRSEQATGAC